MSPKSESLAREPRATPILLVSRGQLVGRATLPPGRGDVQVVFWGARTFVRNYLQSFNFVEAETWQLEEVQAV